MTLELTRIFVEISHTDDVCRFFLVVVMGCFLAHAPSAKDRIQNRRWRWAYDDSWGQFLLLTVIDFSDAMLDR